ncbi:hypothetical protein CLV25_10816 [Acetobacteroides hydrogenigenes]|uniref:Uncharacterized protein n=1 Tax=Acetobacteroides hydrogenigenes TaxID=979970 RepID=A0A4R2ECW7_9BACT|nr:hypothetical protein CLV25_10816 [Acetobacteroides hydrogenigenes]
MDNSNLTERGRRVHFAARPFPFNSQSQQKLFQTVKELTSFTTRLKHHTEGRFTLSGTPFKYDDSS